MELVRRSKITDYCDRNSLATEERLNLFMQTCAAYFSEAISITKR